MGRYARLGTLAVRWMAVGFFVLAIVFLPFGFAGGGTMGSMMEPGAQSTPGGTGYMMQGGGGLWWGPTLLNLVMGTLLFALSKSIGSVMAAGLDD